MLAFELRFVSCTLIWLSSMYNIVVSDKFATDLFQCGNSIPDSYGLQLLYLNLLSLYR